MRKSRAWFCVAATCTLGCSNLAHRIQAPLLPASQSGAVTSLKPALAKVTVSTPDFDPVPRRFAKGHDAHIVPLPKQATLIVESIPAVSKNGIGQVDVAAVSGPAAKDAFENAFGESVRQAVRAAVDVESSVFESLNATVLAATVLVKELEEKEFVAHQQGGAPHSGRALQPEVSKKLWYGLAWIGGAVFTTILAPLVVELIKHRIGIGRPQPDRAGSPHRVGP